LFPECTSSIYITDSEKGQSEAENEGQTIQWSNKGGKEKQRPTNFKQTWLKHYKRDKIKHVCMYDVGCVRFLLLESIILIE
jgi:hypothetical protein